MSNPISTDTQDTGSIPADNKHLEKAYDQICTSYHNIDDFRTKLLGLLPIATGAGIFLLLKSEIFSQVKNAVGKEIGLSQAAQDLQSFFGPIGLFGFVITLGIFAYEIYGIKKCAELIAGGKQIENRLRVDGAFTKRPPDVLNFIREPFAGGIIYSAVLAAWAYIGLRFNTP